MATKSTGSAEALNARLFDDVGRGVMRRPLGEQRAPSARWMDYEQIVTSKLLAFDHKAPGDKVLIGAVGDQLLGISDNRHMMTVAGSRTGKSVGLISNLMFYPGSILATDPKGELAQLTAERRATLGQTIHVLDPFRRLPARLQQFSAAYNPMDILDLDGETFLEDAAQIADAVVVTSPDQRDPHWDESARNFIEGVIIHVATDGEHAKARDLITVRKLLAGALILSGEDEGTATKGPSRYPLGAAMLRNAEMLAMDPEAEPVAYALRTAAQDFYSKAGNELASVQSTIARHTKFLDYPAFRRVLRNSTFKLGDLKTNPKGVSVYLCFPATRAELSKRWMRLFVIQLLDAMEREETIPDVPVLACLDEFPVLGHMRQLETAAGLIASFGVKLWFILQDWSQGKALYGDRWETFAGNAGVLQFFGNNDMATAEYISRRLGKAQVETFSQGDVDGDHSAKGMTGKNRSVNLYDLMTPDEIMRTFARSDPNKRQLVFWAGRHPMILERVEHYSTSFAKLL